MNGTPSQPKPKDPGRLYCALGDMSGYVPTLRGWTVLVLPVVSAFLLLAAFPARFIESGVGTWIAEPVAPSTWAFGAVLILLCVGGCVETFRRGSRVDKVVLVLGAAMTLWLVQEFLSFMLLRVRHPGI